MGKMLKRCMIIILYYIGSVAFAVIMSEMLLVTVCCVIFGSPDDGGSGYLVAMMIEKLLVMFWAMLFIYLTKLKDKEEYMAFTAKVREKGYSAKEDLHKLKRDLDIWFEVLFVSIFTLVYFLMNIRHPLILLNIPAFIIFDFWSTLRIHNIWLNLKRS